MQQIDELEALGGGARVEEGLDEVAAPVGERELLLSMRSKKERPARISSMPSRSPRRTRRAQPPGECGRSSPRKEAVLLGDADRALGEIEGGLGVEDVAVEEHREFDSTIARAGVVEALGVGEGLTGLAEGGVGLAGEEQDQWA
ncbi:MAG: hypothetical protein R3B70_11270 [Polyangiaceae bacterium]